MLNGIYIDAGGSSQFFPHVYKSLTGHESFFHNTVKIVSIIHVIVNACSL